MERSKGGKVSARILGTKNYGSHQNQEKFISCKTAFVADENLRGGNVLLLTSLLREVLKVPREIEFIRIYFQVQKLLHKKTDEFHVYNCIKLITGEMVPFPLTRGYWKRDDLKSAATITLHEFSYIS